LAACALLAVSALKMVDLPTFGKPTIPQFRGMFRFFLNSYWNMTDEP
jgi:hypothetical protein